MKTKDLSNQVTATYKMLRLGLAVLALAFPPLLWIGGLLFAHLPLAGSMSAYYYAGQGVMRNGFVGILFAVGALLFAYQGYSRFEDYALNLAAVLALGIALIPMKWPTEQNDSSFSLHGICAILFFACIAYVCICRAADTLSLIDNDAIRKVYRRTYQVLGWAMVICPVFAWILISRMPFHTSVIFFVEATGIYVFATYWLIKGHETSKTKVDEKATRGQLRVKPHGLSDVLRPLPVTLVNEPNTAQKEKPNDR
jgi:hypothetical protein